MEINRCLRRGLHAGAGAARWQWIEVKLMTARIMHDGGEAIVAVARKLRKLFDGRHGIVRVGSFFGRVGSQSILREAANATWRVCSGGVHGLLEPSISTKTAWGVFFSC